MNVTTKYLVGQENRNFTPYMLCKIKNFNKCNVKRLIIKHSIENRNYNNITMNKTLQACLKLYKAKEFNIDAVRMTFDLYNRETKHILTKLFIQSIRNDKHMNAFFKANPNYPTE